MCSPRYNICLISFFSLYLFLLAFIGADNIGSLVNSLFRADMLNPFPSLTPFDYGADGTL